MTRQFTNEPPLELATLLASPSVPLGVKKAIQGPDGAQFFRCAFQVNPYGYLMRHSKETTYKDELEYNTAMVTACKAAGVQIVAVTDHFRISDSATLTGAFEAAGIVVFPGFEASSSEGIHILCLFAPGTSASEIERHIGACSLADASAESPLSTLTCEKLMELIASLGGISIAAHVCSSSGLLTTLSGHPRARAWKSPNLHAAAMPGSPRDAPQNHRDIVANKDEATKREIPLCIVNANDVSDPSGFADPKSTTLVKMTAVSIEGLRQGFLDWESRVKLNSDLEDTDHTEIVAIAWSGGLFDGQSVRFNRALNVLVGGRGAGKSTLIESLRYALDLTAKGDEAKRSHQGIVKAVLGLGTTVSVLVRSPKPTPRYYLIERIFGQRPVVRDQLGQVMAAVSPQDIIGTVEIFGQHEIFELARQPSKLAEILRRFTGQALDGGENRANFKTQLERSRGAIAREVSEINVIEDELAALPALEEKLKRYATAGLEEKLKEKTDIDAETRLFDAVLQDVSELTVLGDELAPLTDQVQLYIPDGSTLPNNEILRPLNVVSQRIANARTRASNYLRAVDRALQGEVAAIRTNWTPLEREANARYLATVKELEEEGHDPKKYVAIKGQVEALKPKEAQKAARVEKLTQLQEERSALLIEWEKFKADDLVSLKRAAQKVSSRLDARVRVRVEGNRDLTQLEATIRSKVSGNISQPIERLKAYDGLALSELAETIRQGAAALVSKYGFSQSGAERVAEGGLRLALEVEECELAAQAVVELNVSPSSTLNWKALEDLSSGQKATAVLLLLLLESDLPLIVDQPEDDLDNRFIADSIVPTMRVEKRQRQFIFSSHNANIPVLADAEQIVGLTPIVEGGAERTIIQDELCGSIDVSTIKELVKDQLEGGQRAFSTRRDKYGF